MKVTKNEQILYCDIDSTLVFDCEKSHPEAIAANYYKEVRWVRPHHKQIEFLKTLKTRGFYVIAHSGNGHAWAEEIIKKLKLEKYVHEAKSKPVFYIDDLNSECWMGSRIYIPENNNGSIQELK